MKRAVVLGGGVAGIAAAFALRDRGLDVELVESRRWLGGRVFSLPPREGAIAADNGPHVIMGCYDAMRALLRRIGSEDAFVAPRALSLAYAEAGGRRSTLRLTRLPVPLALPVALLRVHGMPLRARLRALRAFVAAPFGGDDGESLAAWLSRHGQDGAPRAWVWDPMCRAIMNADAESVSAAAFLQTVRIAFTGSAARGAIWAPRKPWSEIVGEPARARLAHEGVRVRCGERVVGLDTDGGSVVRIVLHRGSPIEVDGSIAVFAALPWHVLGALLGAPPARLEGSPLVSVYFELDSGRGLPADPVVALVDGEPFHFLCRLADDPPGRVALLAGGSRALDGVAADEIVARARAQLARYFPAAAATSGSARVAKESRATFVAAPGLGSARPAPGRLAPLRNLWICGDWTGTGLPSTLEGAARSAAVAVGDLARS